MEQSTEKQGGSPQAETGHWITWPDARRRFWAWTKQELGLTEMEVHAALQVEHTRDFEGSMQDAKAVIEAWVLDERNEKEAATNSVAQDMADLEERLAERCERLPESPLVAWTTFYSAKGYRWSFTLRAGLPPDLTVEAMRQTREAIQVFETGAKAYGWIPANGASPVAPSGPVAPSEHRAGHGASPVPQRPEAPSPPPRAPATATEQPAGQPNGDARTETFEVASVTAQLTPNGNRYYAVKGGRYMKHGVTAWPEVAEPQLAEITEWNPAELTVGQEWQVAAWGIVAVAEVPEGKANPTKVVAFQQA